MKGGKLLSFFGLAHCHPPSNRLHDGEIADRLGVEALLAHSAGDGDPPRSTERQVTIGCHASLSSIFYLSIDRFSDTLAIQSCQPLSIDRTRHYVGSFCGWYMRDFSGLPKATSPRPSASMPPSPGGTSAAFCPPAQLLRFLVFPFCPRWTGQPWSIRTSKPGRAHRGACALN